MESFPVYSIYVSFQMCTFPSTYLCNDLGQGLIGENDRRGKKKTTTLFLPWESPWDPNQPSWRDQSPLIMYAHTHCMFGALKHCPLT